MSKIKMGKKGVSGLLASIIFIGGALPNFVSAQGSDNVINQEKLSTIEHGNPELSMEQITLMIKQHSISEGMTESESLEIFYDQAHTQQLNQVGSGYSSTSTSPNQAPGPARNRGDVMYSDAWTGINHGHSAIYYTTNIVVHAPGLKKVSRAESANNKIGLKRGIHLQYVNTSQANRDKAAQYAYSTLRNRPYDLYFANNKKTLTVLNCSSLVWNAYYRTSKINLDSNGGPGVYPFDIRNSSRTVTYARK